MAAASISGRPVHPLLDLARFLAILLVAAKIASLLLPWFFKQLVVWLHGLSANRRVVLLGYGPVGQAIADRLMGRNMPKDAPRRAGQKLITAVHRGLSSDLVEHARKAGVVLVEGDPADPRIHRRIAIKAAKAVFVSGKSDMASLDAAIATSANEPAGKVRAILSNADLASSLQETAARGFLGAADIVVYSLVHETARLLIAEARFDRTALELGQKRAHVLIIGAGSIGEAIASEILLTAWRVGLQPPIVSLFDKDKDDIYSRFARRAPALFREDKRSPLDEAGVEFYSLDADTVDFAEDPAIQVALERSGPRHSLGVCDW